MAIDHVIEVDRLGKSFGDTPAVVDISFAVPAGSVVGLLGENGAGKTTTINCLTTLLRPDTGTAKVAGHDIVREANMVRANIALTGQFAAVDDAMTGVQNLVFFGRLLGLGRKQAAERAGELLDKFGIEDAGQRLVGTYSGGMRRRLDLAISLVVPKPVLFLDEPTTGLDPRSRQALWDIVRELAASGMGVLLTTQYLEEADALADHVVVINHGLVVGEGTPTELKKRVGGSVLEVRIEDAVDRRETLALLVGIDGVSVHDDTVTVPLVGTDSLAGVTRRLDRPGHAAADIVVRGPTLNDVFFALTDDVGPVTDQPGPAEVLS